MVALRMAQKGHHVLVIDWRQNLGDKLCTGIIGRECAERFPPEKSHIHVGAQSATVISPFGTTHHVEKSNPVAYVVDRVSYVASFASEAQENGAEYRLGEKIQEIQCLENQVSVNTISEFGKKIYLGKTLVICSGFASPLVRMVNLSENNSDHLIGSQAEVTVSDIENIQVFLSNQISPGFFGWLVPLENSRALAGFVSRRSLNGHMENFITRLKKSGAVNDITKEPTRWGIPIRPISKTYKDRVIVAGDAAGFTKPTTGGGIYYALLSGEIAAQTILGAIKANNFSESQMSSYESNWKAIFGKEMLTGYYARRLYELLGDKQIEVLLDKFLSSDIQEEFLSSPDFSFDWHSDTILSAIYHKDLGKLLKSFGPSTLKLISRLSTSISG